MERQFVGAKWWKFDFHTHTPASVDFDPDEKESTTPEIWLRKFMEKEIDCVAVTDHNSGEFIDKLNDALDRLRNENPDWFRPITIFPGVEISVNGGVHLLAIFGTDKSTSDIDSLLGAVRFNGDKGNSDGVTEESMISVVETIISHGGVAIPAHVDKRSGLFKETQGVTLSNILNSSHIYAMELLDETCIMPELYRQEKTHWTRVVGSDTHRFSQDSFGAFTWVKMDTPSIEGLKLALIDGNQSSVICDMVATPNKHTDLSIESFEVSKCKYIGTSSPLHVEFSPFLNTIIGGRGSGKSTLIEFMRLALNRHSEIENNINLSNEQAKYFDVDDPNALLTAQSELHVEYRKESTLYKISYSALNQSTKLQVQNNGSWVEEDGDVKSRFPVRIYSQKQVLELAKNPQALLHIIDESSLVEKDKILQEINVLSRRYKTLCLNKRELENRLASKSKLAGELNDIDRQLQEIEKSEHAKVLAVFRLRTSQKNEIARIEREWSDMRDLINEFENKIAEVNINSDVFSDHPDILESLAEYNRHWEKTSNDIKLVANNTTVFFQRWQQNKENSEWFAKLREETNRYSELTEKLSQSGIDPDRYPVLVQQKFEKKEEIAGLQVVDVQLKQIDQEEQVILQKLSEGRTMLTTKRRDFLREVLRDTAEVGIKIEPFGESIEQVEKSIRKILRCESSTRFTKDIEYLIGEIYAKNGHAALYEYLSNVYGGNLAAQDKRFQNHLQTLPMDAWVDLRVWFPEDGVIITYAGGKALQQGSPGQKSASLLAFILSYGTEPLLLDQPEDDLDNELIYDLIVKQIRASKPNRQIIIVTHNANIVVNGDAEMVHPLMVKDEQTLLNDSAGLQNNAVRKRICDIMEGGRTAFDQRYKRIHLETEITDVR